MNCALVISMCREPEVKLATLPPPLNMYIHAFVSIFREIYIQYFIVDDILMSKISKNIPNVNNNPASYERLCEKYMQKYF